MQLFIWTPEHCQALREYRARGLSYGEIAQRLNAKFGTTYTRNAALGRGMRMGLPSPEGPEKRAKRLPAIGVQKRPKCAVVAKPATDSGASAPVAGVPALSHSAASVSSRD
jgi:hypothetical protein